MYSRAVTVTLGYRALTTGSALRALPSHRLTSPPCSPPLPYSFYQLLYLTYYHSLPQDTMDDTLDAQASSSHGPGWPEEAGAELFLEQHERRHGQTNSQELLRAALSHSMARLLLEPGAEPGYMPAAQCSCGPAMSSTWHTPQYPPSICTVR